MSLYLGCPVWGLKKWAGTFFPAGAKQREFLRLYSRRLNAVEGNTTFYAVPSADTVARWRAETPPDFRFCLKFPQSISHRRRLRGAEVETQQFLECLQQLGDRRGPSFLQLPPNFGPKQLPTLEAYLATLPDDLDLAVEVRHPDFFASPGETALDQVLAARQVARVLVDVRGLLSAEPHDEATATAQERKPLSALDALKGKPRVPVRFTRTGAFAFVRYIGHPRLPANASLLNEWAQHVSGWLAAGEDVYFFLHSPTDVLSPALARDLHARVSARQPLPPLPDWRDAPQEPQQPSLL